MSTNTGFYSSAYSNDLINIFPKIEARYLQIYGDNGSNYYTIGITGNGTTNYAVFTSVYYNYGGSGGTYDAMASSGALNTMIISNKATTSFGLNLQKSTGDNVNLYLCFLIVYNSGFPAS